MLGDRRDLEADKDVANVEVVLPAPVVNESWPQSGGFANHAMHNLAINDSPQVIWSADVGAGSTTTRILTTPPVVADGKAWARRQPPADEDVDQRVITCGGEVA